MLSHTRSKLSVASTRAVMCVGLWNKADLVKVEDINSAAMLPALGADEREELAPDWDKIEVI